MPKGMFQFLRPSEAHAFGSGANGATPRSLLGRSMQGAGAMRRQSMGLSLARRVFRMSGRGALSRALVDTQELIARATGASTFLKAFASSPAETPKSRSTALLASVRAGRQRTAGGSGRGRAKKPKSCAHGPH